MWGVHHRVVGVGAVEFGFVRPEKDGPGVRHRSVATNTREILESVRIGIAEHVFRTHGRRRSSHTVSCSWW